MVSSLKYFAVACCLAVFGSAVNADAQACGAYYINVSVQDTAGKAVSNAKVDLKPIEKDESAGKNFARDAKEPSRFTLQLSEGQDSQFFHKIVVSAPGYNSAETQLKFHSCANRLAVVNLVKAGSPATAVWHYQNTVEIQVAGKDGENIDGLKLTVIDVHGKEETVPTQKWFAFFDLPNGEYTLRIEVPGYQTLNEKLDLKPLADVSLKLQVTKKN
jgi:PEGA domain